MPKLKTTIEIEIEVHFSYRKAEQATKDSPGCPEEVDIFNTTITDNIEDHDDEIEDLIWANRDSWEED